MTSVLSFLGHDLLTSFACTLGSITNSGSGLSHILGWKGTYDDFQNAEKLCLIVGMIMGRLELITLFLLFMPSFWKK